QPMGAGRLGRRHRARHPAPYGVLPRATGFACRKRVEALRGLLAVGVGLEGQVGEGLGAEVGQGAPAAGAFQVALVDGGAGGSRALGGGGRGGARSDAAADGRPRAWGTAAAVRPPGAGPWTTRRTSAVSRRRAAARPSAATVARTSAGTSRNVVSAERSAARPMSPG